MSDEIIYFEGRIPARVFLFQHRFLWLLLFGWNIGLLAAFLHSFSWHVRITSRRLALTRGVIGRKDEQIEYYRIKDTTFEQGFLQRLAGVGTLTLFSDDPTAGPEFSLPLHDPGGFCEKIREAVQAERIRLGSRQID